jgi:hypothetical protein
MKAWLSFFSIVGVVALFVWSDENEAVAAVVHPTALWLFRLAVLWTFWGLTRENFATSFTPWRSFKAALWGVLVAAALFTLNDECIREENCDSGGGCWRTCYEGTMTERAQSLAKWAAILGVPVLAAGWEHRKRIWAARTGQE